MCVLGARRRFSYLEAGVRGWSDTDSFRYLVIDGIGVETQARSRRDFCSTSMSCALEPKASRLRL
jgi:hypothetical protein